MKAFPSNGFYEKTGGGEQPQIINPVFGMDLRDYFAAKAMQSFLSFQDVGNMTVAKEAYMMADAMMEARNDNK